MKMKNIYTIFLVIAALLYCETSFADGLSGKVKIGEVEVAATEDEMTLSFEIRADERAVYPNEVLALMPVISNGEYKISMAPVFVKGKRAKINELRYELATGGKIGYSNELVLGNGESVGYEVSIPVQLWMAESRIVLEAEMFGCSEVVPYENMFIAEGFNIPLRRGEPILEIVERPVPAFVPLSIADTLAQNHSFIIPASEYDVEEPFTIYDEERELSMSIYFKQGSKSIDHTYMDNAQTIQNLIAAVNMIQASGNSRVKYVVVVGFSSPEGGFEVNDRLAFERAVSVKEYIMKTTDMNADKLKIFNGSIDWRGVKLYTQQSDLTEIEKQQVAHIIDTVPIWDSQRQIGRHGEIMRLNGGNTYRYLKKNIFPKLRNGAFLKVYYENE